MQAKELLSGIVSGNRRSLSRAITLIESMKPEHRQLATQILQDLPLKSNTMRVGICGSPGAGKSTLIEALGLNLVSKGRFPAVLAMDPSSNQFGGSILGDKTRMAELSRNEKVFVRPSPTRGVLGGVTSSCSENILLCEAGGYDTVLVETVGLGQSETTVDEVSDLVMLVTSPAGGDSLQGIKKGIMEVADLIVINKAEPPYKERAKSAKHELEQAIKLNIRRYNSWVPPVVMCSATKKQGIDEIIEQIDKAGTDLRDQILLKRKKQMAKNCERMLQDLLTMKLNDIRDSKEYSQIMKSLDSKQLIPRSAAIEILQLLSSKV